MLTCGGQKGSKNVIGEVGSMVLTWPGAKSIGKTPLVCGGVTRLEWCDN